MKGEKSIQHLIRLSPDQSSWRIVSNTVPTTIVGIVHFHILILTKGVVHARVSRLIKDDIFRRV